MQLLNSISENLTSFEKKAIIFILVSFLIGGIYEIFGSQRTGEEKKINLNTATVEELATVPGIGRKTAEKIVKFRIEKGRLENIEEIKDVIGESKFRRVKKYFTVKGQN